MDYLVGGAGSGGTYSGIVKYLKEQDPSVQGVLADPVGSTMGGGEHSDYDIEGIGNDFIPDTMDISLVDQVIERWYWTRVAIKDILNILKRRYSL